MDDQHMQKQYSSGGGRPRGWLRNVCQVDWTCIFFIIVLGIATGIVQRAATVQRPVFVGDATIAYPHRPSNSVAFWVALVIPALVLLASAAVLEFVVFGRQQGRRQAWLMLLNVVLALLATLAVTGFITELFKRICGRLRPDFLDRCQPADLPPGANPVEYGTFPNVKCTAQLSSQLKDGHLSFPSGHSSCSMCVGLFGALYVMWAVHMRGSRDSLGPMAACSSSGSGGICLRAWLRAELLRLVLMLVVLFQMAWPWGVAVSRFRDNRHNVSDVVGGLLLGVCFAPFFMARLAWLYSGWTEFERQEEAGILQQQLQLQQGLGQSQTPIMLPVGGSSSALGHSSSSGGGVGGAGGGVGGAGGGGYQYGHAPWVNGQGVGMVNLHH